MLFKYNCWSIWVIIHSLEMYIVHVMETKKAMYRIAA